MHRSGYKNTLLENLEQVIHDMFSFQILPHVEIFFPPRMSKVTAI